MRQGFVTIPATGDVVLANARWPRLLVAGEAAPHLCDDDPQSFLSGDIVIVAGRVASFGGPRPEGVPVVDLRGGLVLPRFVDGHTHIDKGHISARMPNPDGTFLGALNAVAADREANWSAEDVARRMDFSLRCALAHGTGALRTHLDSLGKQAGISWPVFSEMRATWKGRIDLQAVAIFPTDMVVEDPAQFRALVATVVKHGGVLGGVSFRGEAPGPRHAEALDTLFQVAAAEGLDVDLHVDESASPDARTLPMIADSILRTKFKGKVVAGHCCSLALYAENERAVTIGKLRDSGLAVVSLPMCNMYLQDRTGGRTPRWRGVVPLQELASAGVPVMVASDNTRDPFYAYGDLDMLEVFREAVRILHLDHSSRGWLDLLSARTADVMGFAGGRLAPGMPADLVLVNARTVDELICRPQWDRVVLIAGRAIDTTPPDYRELDAQPRG